MLDPRLALADRIYYGWVIAGACLLATILVFGPSFAFSVFYESFLDEFGTSRTVMATVFGVQTALMFILGVGAGRIVDVYGPRYVAGLSTVCLAGGLLWSGFARSFLELLVAFGVVCAAGMAGFYVIGYASVPQWFQRRRGTAAGLASAGLGVGLITIPPGAEVLINSHGWRPAIMAIAVVAAVLGTGVWFFFVGRPQDVGADRSIEFDDVESSDQATDGPTDEVADESTDDDRCAPTDGSADRTTPEPREILRSTPFLLVVIGWTFVFTPMYILLAHVVLHTTEIGIGRGAGVLAITVIGITTTLSRLGIGTLSDSFGRTKTYVVCAAVLGVSTAALVVPSTAVFYLAIIVVFGVAYGGCGGLLAALIADLFGERNLNVLFAVASLAFAASGLLAPPLAGAIFEQVGSYTPALIGSGAIGVVGAGCVAVAGRMVDGGW